MEQDTQNLLEMIDRPAFIVRDGVITDCNQMAKNRLIRIGKSISEFLPEDQNPYRDFRGGVLYLTLRIGWIQCGATVVRRADGDVFLMDRDHDKAQLQALSLAAQHLRVPLSDVMTIADSLFPQLQDNAQQEKAAQMRRALFQLMRLISNMADADRYTGLNAPRFENTELCEFFREIIERADASLERTGITLHYSRPDLPIFTIIDRERMERAVYNLLSNAVKFSAPGTCVEIKLARREKLACLTIEDQGDGIVSHVAGSLFHRYLREPAIEDNRFGLGLGMTLVRSAASIHGGSVLLEQTRGTRVAMTIAIRREAPGSLRSPQMRIGDYAGGRDLGLLEFADSLPAAAYEKDI